MQIGAKRRAKDGRPVAGGHSDGREGHVLFVSFQDMVAVSDGVSWGMGP